jgi:hypothetical protein
MQQTLRGRQDVREYNKRKDEEYRKKRNDELGLLRKCIPGTEKLTRPQILKNAVNYIQQLLNPDFMVQDQEMLPQTHKKDIKEHREYMRIKSDEYRNVMKEEYNLLREWVPGTSTLSRLELLKRTVMYIHELEEKNRSPMEKRGIQELEHKIKELEKELFKKQENYIKELEHKENYIKELEQKIKELETSQRPHRSFTDLDTGLTEMVDTDLDTGLCSSEMADLTTMVDAIQTSMEISVEEELLASGIPEFNSFEHFTQWLDCENCLM